MTDREELVRRLNVLFEDFDNPCFQGDQHNEIPRTIGLLMLENREDASALSAQQPVAWYIEGGTQMWWQESRPTDPGEWEPLYASPPPAQQGPTEEEVKLAQCIVDSGGVFADEFVAATAGLLLARVVLRMAGTIERKG